MKSFRQVSIDELRIPNAIVLRDGGEWSWMKDFICEELGSETILLEEDEPEQRPILEGEIEQEKTPEEQLYDRIEMLSASNQEEKEQISDEINREIEGRYRTGQSVQDIAKSTGVAAAKVRDSLIRSGVPMRISRMFFGKIRRAAEDGQSIQEIANEYHTDVDHIRDVIGGNK